MSMNSGTEDKQNKSLEDAMNQYLDDAFQFFVNRLQISDVAVFAEGSLYELFREYINHQVEGILKDECCAQWFLTKYDEVMTYADTDSYVGKNCMYNLFFGGDD